MQKIIFFTLLLFLLTSCSGRTEQIPPEPENGYVEQENNGGYEIPIIEETPVPVETPKPEIPRYNEYRITLDVDPSERTVSGISHITFTNRASVELDEIVLRVYLNAFSEGVEPPPVFSELEWRAFPNGQDYGFLEIQNAFLDNEPLEFELDETILRLILPEPLEPYATVQLLLQYNARVPKIAHRTGGNDYALWFGMFLPVLSVFDKENGWFTREHYPAGNPFFVETASFRVDVTTPARFVVAGTGSRTEEVIGDTDTKITSFAAHQARNFSFAVSPYFQYAHTSTQSGIDIHFYYYTETLPIDDILDTARKSMEFFEERVGPYPLGHVTMAEADLLQDSASFSQMVFVDSWYLARGGRYWAMAHGLGNQWLANIIGTNRVEEPWLTEGLTRFIQTGFFYQTPDELRERMERDRASIEERTTLFLNRGLEASPNWAHYAHAHGRKAMLMVYSLYNRMGDELFWEFINEYYQAFSFGIATQNDFIGLAEELSGENLREFFDEWLTVGTVPELP
ncbi:MAG: M1 family metallopeptidase [Defluviitaleaceae bacterium]|nr:M1 family metallopeptidase [Defluviitaleaceae bacterium]